MSDPFSLRGRMALVTGATRGLGLAIARSLGAAGAEVMLNGRDAAALAGAVAALRGESIAAASVPFDVTDESAVQAAFAGIAKLDIFVGAVGMRHRAPAAALSQEEFRRVSEVNLTASFGLARAALEKMLPQRNGRIIFVTSIAGPIARAGDAAYTAAKGGLAALTRALAVEYGAAGITVNAIAPGYFATETNRAMVEDREVQAFLARRCPLRRWGEPGEIGGAAVFLASEAASYINGHTLTVDGGLSAAF
jgi:gluconate 5-dehydrogenase